MSDHNVPAGSLCTKQLDQLTNQKKSMDIFEQLAEIRAEESRLEEREKLVKNLLTETELPVTKIASLTDRSVYFVNKMKKAICAK
jgi:hypothetical protein